ncbi:DUF4178 domain-containing protein [Buchananella hordeovulneris]|uniref:DUF4178 domain-containing protein n=1 Tax=Buchananella hordeovulneris TaxID=52770 RepID=A0A1Q5PYT7_9ACTO|nr:DUF4178 domain-containing protein [Buchananella hordeovulneris]OKL52791.1 hypothetical protein BSZ40_01425 [Buchananella hordeovulneris]
MSNFRAHLEMGQTFILRRHALRVVGAVLLREYDEEDKRDYFWEEWQLAGAGSDDAWLEFDHYSGDVHLSIPAYFTEPIDPRHLRKDARLRMTDAAGRPCQIWVREVGRAQVSRALGKCRAWATTGKPVHYADLDCTVGVGKELQLSVEWYQGGESRVYSQLKLSRAELRAVFGQSFQFRVGPVGSNIFSNLGTGGKIVATLAALGIGTAVIAGLSNSDRCDPLEDDNCVQQQDGNYRYVYGGGGSGGGK